MLGIGGFITVATAFTILADLPEKVDPLVHTTSEAEAEHASINTQLASSEQTQAGFNAYALAQILQQEVDILKLKIDAEEDEDEKELLREELKAKQAMIRQLEEEQRKQLMKKGEG